MIVCQVTGAAITPKGTELLTSGMVQAVPVRFQLPRPETVCGIREAALRDSARPPAK